MVLECKLCTFACAVNCNLKQAFPDSQALDLSLQKYEQLCKLSSKKLRAESYTGLSYKNKIERFILNDIYLTKGIKLCCCLNFFFSQYS